MLRRRHAPSNVTHVGRLWFAGQPDAETLRKAKENGLRVVLNLRDPAESEWDERSAVEGLGMVYYNVPSLWTALEVHTDLQAGRYLAIGLNSEFPAYEFDIKRTRPAGSGCTAPRR